MKYLLLTILLIQGLGSSAQKDTAYHHLTVRLLKAERPTPHCGVIAWAITQKFEIMESDFPPMKVKYPVLLYTTCPEFYGNHYFIAGKAYKVKVTEINTAPFTYTIVNNYKKDDLPSFWIQEIEPINN